jgi:hypothetical protein
MMRAQWEPIDVNLWEREGWYISRLGSQCYWLSIPNATEFGPFSFFEDAKDAVEDMQGNTYERR